MTRAPLSVVIPTLEAAAVIGPCLAALIPGLERGVIRELVIVDGGSSDEIAAVAEGVGARLIAAPPGRGGQLAAGVAASSGAWVLVLHADTVLSPDWSEAVAAHMARHPQAAGYCALRFDDPGLAAGFVAGWANLRSRLFGLPFGDQGLLMPRSLYDAAGGYPEIPLMEDVALVRAIRRFGGRAALRPLGATALSSAERYRRDGWLRRGARNLWLLARYSLGADPAVLAAAYARRREPGGGA
ncbi:MAG: TIGR04283 family arsenosugar biosynthesis glycosyltransferase [Pseudomonadota bacterium]